MLCSLVTQLHPSHPTDELRASHARGRTTPDKSKHSLAFSQKVHAESKSLRNCPLQSLRLMHVGRHRNTEPPLAPPQGPHTQSCCSLGGTYPECHTAHSSTNICLGPSARSRGRGGSRLSPSAQTATGRNCLRCGPHGDLSPALAVQEREERKHMLSDTVTTAKCHQLRFQVHSWTQMKH